MKDFTFSIFRIKSRLFSPLMFLVLIALMNVADAQTLASWNFAGEPGNQEFTAGIGNTNVVALNFTRGADIVPSAATNSISASGWDTGDDRYFSFGLSIAEGFTADLSNIIIATRSSNTGPGELALRYSGDNFSTDLATWVQVGTNFINQTIDLSALTNISGTVEFRIVSLSNVSAGGGTVSSGGTLRVTNFFPGDLPVSINGTINEDTPPVNPALVTWDFTGEPGNQVFTAGTGSDHMVALNFTRGADLNPSAANNSISASGWDAGDARYFSFGFEVEEGFAVSLENLVIASRSSNTGPGELALRYSVDNFSADLATWIQSGTNFNNQIIDLSSLSNLTGTVEFRIVNTSNVSAAGGTIGSGGTFRINNYLQDGIFTPVTFNGTVSELPPPEPQVIANWNFTGEPGNQISTAGTSIAGVTAIDFARGAGINPASASNSISSNGWNAGDDRFFTFGFTVAPDKLVDLTTLQIGTRSSNTGPRDMALRYSGDNFSSDLATWVSVNEFLNQTIDLSQLTNLQGTVEFRIVTTSDVSATGGAIGSTGTFRVTNFFTDNAGTTFNGFIKDADGVTIPTLNASVASLDFGVQNLNNSPVILSYELSASNLSNDVEVTVSAPFSISKDGVSFSESISFSIAELASAQNIFVQASTTEAGNFAATIVHQSTGASPLTVTVSSTVIDPFNITENFNTSCPDGLPSGWIAYNSVGAQVWACTTFGRAGTTPTASAPFGVQINGFSGGPQLNEDWLITPAFDLRDFDFPLLSFWSRVAFSGPRLKLLVSTNYNGGNPLAEGIVWEELSDRFANSDVWTFSEEINLAAYKVESLRIAFVYNSSPEDNAARWTLDDFALRNSENPPAPFLSNSIGNVDYFHFGIVPVGSVSSITRSFTFSLSDAVAPLTISSANGFEFSKDGANFSSALTYTPEESSSNNTVTIRFAPASQGAFSGPIVFESGDIFQKKGFLSGATLERDKTFDVVTWNIEWFGSTAPGQGPSNVNLQLQNVKTIIEDLDADVYAFQEITNLDKFFELVDALPAYRGFFSPAASAGGGFDGAQKLTFLYKTATVDSIGSKVLLQGVTPDLLVGYPSSPDRFWASGRLPFLFEVKAKIDGVEQHINLINIHARSNGGGESTANPRYAMRRYDVNVLKDTLDHYYANIPFIILGDYNDDLDETVADQSAPTVNTSETSFINYINDPENYTPVTLSLSNAGLRTFIAFENVIDHVIISNEMNESWVVNSERVVVPFDLVTNYQNTTSDHLPVKVRFQLKPKTFIVGNCEFLSTDFPGAQEIIAVKAVTYADFSTSRGTYVIGIATGIRNDGRAGAWEIHNDCSIHPIRRSGLVNNTTLLPNVRGVEFERGWRYQPLSISEDGKEIFALAINDDGYTHPRGWTIEPGTTVDIKFTLGRPFFGRIFGVSGTILCENLNVETFAGNYFVTGCNITRIGQELVNAKAKSILENIQAYPNPIVNKLNLNIPSLKEENAIITVYNERLEIIYSTTVTLKQGDNSVEINADAWKAGDGLLILNIITNSQGAYQAKFIKR